MSKHQHPKGSKFKSRSYRFLDKDPVKWAKRKHKKDSQHKWRSCDKKKKYDEHCAKEKVVELNNEPDLRNIQHAYECSYCEYWHTGRKPKPLVKNRFEKFRELEYLQIYEGLDYKISSQILSENWGSQSKRFHVVKGKILGAVTRAKKRMGL